ncbi:hypothetical protein GGR56DRAFT_24783 [Xylariaceae sp. FL0804]|nr:hypothetical protein GGR56DRAFT_24783 [Xylariaceae sp. FL0804]
MATRLHWPGLGCAGSASAVSLLRELVGEGSAGLRRAAPKERSGFKPQLLSQSAGMGFWLLFAFRFLPRVEPRRPGFSCPDAAEEHGVSQALLDSVEESQMRVGLRCRRTLFPLPDENQGGGTPTGQLGGQRARGLVSRRVQLCAPIPRPHAERRTRRPKLSLRVVPYVRTAAWDMQRWKQPRVVRG